MILVLFFDMHVIISCLYTCMYIYKYSQKKQKRRRRRTGEEQKRKKTNERLVIGAKNLSNLLFELMDHIFFRWNIGWSWTSIVCRKISKRKFIDDWKWFKQLLSFYVRFLCRGHFGQAKFWLSWQIKWKHDWQTEEQRRKTWLISCRHRNYWPVQTLVFSRSNGKIISLGLRQIWQICPWPEQRGHERTWPRNLFAIVSSTLRISPDFVWKRSSIE